MNRPANHQKTGNRVGRPAKISQDLGARIIQALARRTDPETGLVRPSWKTLAAEVGVSRSTVARQIARLREAGSLERVVIPSGPETADAFYRIHASRR